MQNSDFDPLTTRDLEPAFWTPERLGRPSAWWGHVPFAFWLVVKCEPRQLVELGTHYGVSYAAFCEAVSRLRLGTRCYAVDTWAGDPHAGAYDEDVYAELKEFHDKRYASFSQLVRKTFDEACGDFADGSIDLLHIDGFHTYEAVRHDFETWRPKLSARAIVLFHDTNERQRDFGVWRFLEELKRDAPAFEFLHEHGLGVVAVGSDVPEAVRRLCGLRDGAEIAAVRERFSLIGSRWKAEQERSSLAAHTRVLDAHVRGLEDEIAQKQDQVTDLQSSLATARKQNDEARKRNDVLLRHGRALEDEGQDVVRQLAASRRNDFDGRLPRQLKGLRWMAPRRWKKLRRLAGDYRLIAASPLFDRRWYLANNPDVAIKSENPVLHYLMCGAREGRAPGPHFDGVGYLKANPDVAALQANPLVHYIRCGRDENRRITGAKDGRAPVGRRLDGVPQDPSSASSLETLPVPLPYGKALYMKRCELAVFRVRTAGPICFPPRVEPFFSIIVPAFNKFSYNIRVLELLEHAVSYTNARNGLGIEVIFIDDSSTDETSRLEEYVKGIVFRRTSPNMGFLRACNFGASLATGAYLVFLNNDVEFGPDIFVRLHDAIERDKAEVACFGGEILQFDGSIQDLGSGIWRDGVAQGYFRNEPPIRHAYAYPRDVDYVAGCFFCLSAAEFSDFGGLAECFAPGYYEETDLSLRLWKAGRRSRVYPDIRVYHLEYGSFSSEAPRKSLELMTRNRPILAQRHKDLLDERPEIKPSAGYPVRYGNVRLRILFIEDRVPALCLGTGYGRSEIMVRALLKEADVDIYACSPKDDEALPDGFEYIDIIYGPDVDVLEQRLSSRHYDAIYICRPHNFAVYEKPLQAWMRAGGSVVYDTEAVFAVRDIARAEQAESYSAITGSARFADLLGKEVRPAEIADVIIAVNEAEAAILQRQLNRPVLTIGHYLPVRPLGRNPTERSGLLFVGPLRGEELPNYDSLVWFLDHVWPRIRAVRPEETLRIAGYIRPDAPVDPLLREGVTCLGPVPDLTAEYARARVFIAPTRFAAGVPFKVHEALSYGLPVVSSRLIGEQLAHGGNGIGGVQPATVKDDGREFADACLQLLEDDDLWLERQAAAIAHMESHCGPSALSEAVSALLRELRERPPGTFRMHGQNRAIDLQQWRDEITLTDETSPILDRAIGVFVHLFYEDLADEVADYLTRIDLPKKIYVSTNSDEKRGRIADAFERAGLGSVSEYAVVPNCGYDIAPLLVQFREKVSDHDICLKIHGKRSASERFEFGERWRNLLFQDLIGDRERVRAIVGAMLARPDLGIVMAPHYHRIEACVNIGPNYEPMRKILAKIGVGLRQDQEIEFPSGSMFWFRSEALAKLVELDFDWSDFDADSRQKDGTLAHGIERCFLFFCASVGERWGFLAPYRTGPKISRDKFVRLIRASGAFDEAFYKAAYPDVRDAGVDPFEHWLNVGAREGREPSDPRTPNPEVYRLLEHHLRGLPLVADKPVQSSGTRPKDWHCERGATLTQPTSSRSLKFSPLEPSNPLTQYNELAPAAQSAPISPSFVLGPFPEFLTNSYFADVTALSVGCYTLKKIGVTSHGLLVRDGKLLTSGQLSLSEESIKEAASYGSICAKREFSRIVDEPVVSLAGPGHLIYGHWLVDFLPKLYLLQRNGIDPSAVNYLLPANTPRFALSWLQLLGISERQFVFFEPYEEAVGATCLFVPTLLRTNGRTHPLFRSAIEYLLSLIPRRSSRAHGNGAGRRIYLSRGGDGPENRKLLNRRGIEQIAVDRGYTVVRPETLSITDQLTMLSRARCIVGEYGSALHGSLFAPPGTVVCALRASARHPGFLQSGLCQAMGQKIGYVFGSAGEHDVEQKFSIPEDEFSTALTLVDMYGTD